ncbi:MAG: hypothetical protein LUH36_08365 [Oscillospiraceae bacterium]|nr:hypothetical protein [Oscillospiraceae bacterium]
MTGWAVFGIVIPSLVLLGTIPVGVDVSWGRGTFSLKIRVGPFPFRALPKGPGDGKRRHKFLFPGKDKEEPVRLPLPVLKALVLRGCDALCRAVRRARVDTLRIRYTAAGPDPYEAALAYGAAGTAMEGLLALAGGRIAHPDLRADVDFDGSEQSFSGAAVATMRLYQAMAIGGRFALGLWRDWRAYRKNRKGAEDSE